VKKFDVVDKLGRYCRDHALEANRHDLPGPWGHQGHVVICDGALLFRRQDDAALALAPPPPLVVASHKLFEHPAEDLGWTTGRRLLIWAGPLPRQWSPLRLQADHSPVVEASGRVGRATVDRRYVAIVARGCANDERVTVAFMTTETGAAVRLVGTRWSMVLMSLRSRQPKAPSLRLQRAQ
jgi:hypothetical protein